MRIRRFTDAGRKPRSAYSRSPELLPVPGIDIVGPLPGDMQRTIVYVAGVPVEAHGVGAAKAFTSAAAVTVLKQKGMDPS
jgi:molybdate transport system substrate-binding protein